MLTDWKSQLKMRLLVIGCGVVCALSCTIANAQIVESFTEPYETIRLSTAEAGRVDKVYVELGDKVQSGDLILSLDNSVLELSREMAEADVNATGEIEFAKSELTLKSNRLEKLKSVQSNGFAGMNELEIAKSEFASAKAKVQATVDEQNLSRLEVKRIEAQLEQRRVRSRINGVIIEMLHKPGEYVSASEPQTAVVADLNRLRTKFHLTTRQAQYLHEGQIVQLQLIDASKSITGTIEYVSPVTSARSLTVRVDVIIDNHKSKIRSGIPVRLVLE